MGNIIFLSDKISKSFSFKIFLNKSRGIPLSLLVRPFLFFVQSPIETIGSLINICPVGFNTLDNSFNTELTLGIWCKVPNEVIKSKLPSGKFIPPLDFGGIYRAVTSISNSNSHSIISISLYINQRRTLEKKVAVSSRGRIYESDK